MSRWYTPTKLRRKIRQDCARKIAYEAQDQAEAAIRVMEAAGRLVGSASVYRCRSCCQFHWGHVSSPQMAELLASVPLD